MKKCNKCNQEKELTEFYSSKTYKRYKDGVDHFCKNCRNGDTLKYHRGPANVVCTVDGCEIRHYAKGYCRLHYDRIRNNGRIYTLREVIPADVEKLFYKEVNGKMQKAGIYSLERRLEQKYNMTLEQYEFFAQHGCNVCGSETGSRSERNLHVDHDHKCCPGVNSCGECVRGVVCGKCNTAIGYYERGKLRDDYPNKAKIVKYLDDYETRVKKLDNLRKWHDIIVDPENKRQEW
jgi:hypothetical protein